MSSNDIPQATSSRRTRCPLVEGASIVRVEVVRKLIVERNAGVDNPVLPLVPREAVELLAGGLLSQNGPDGPPPIDVGGGEHGQSAALVHDQRELVVLQLVRTVVEPGGNGLACGSSTAGEERFRYPTRESPDDTPRGNPCPER